MKIKDLLYPVKTKPLYQMVNAWDVVDNVLVGVDGSMTICYDMVFLPDLVHFSRPEEDGFLKNFCRALQIIPDDYVLHFVVSGRWGNYQKIEEYKKLIEPGEGLPSLAREVVARKVREFGKMDTRRLFYKLYITQPATSVMKITDDAFYLNKLSARNYTEKIHETRIHRLEDNAENFVQAVKSVGIVLKRLTKDEIINELYRRLNPGRQAVEFKPLPGETLRSQIVLSAALNGFNYARIGNLHFAGLNLYYRPEEVHFFHIAKFLAKLQVNFDVVWTVQYVPDNLKSDAPLRKRMKFNATLSAGTMTKEGVEKSQAIERMLEETFEASERIYNFTLCVIVQENNPEFLQKKLDAGLSAFREIGDAEAVIDDMNHLHLYLHTLPGHWFFNRRIHPFSQSAIIHLLPIHRPWSGCKQPKMLFPTAGGELIGIDMFDPELPAKHGLIIGSTGAGKSFTTNYILTNFLIESEKNHVIIIDVGGSYRKLCEVFGGQYIDIQFSDEYAFNPFPPKSYFYKDKQIDADEILFMEHIIQKMLQIPKLDGRQQMIIENSIKIAYEKAKGDVVTLGDLSDVLKDYPGDEEDRKEAYSFYKNLAPWTTGRYSILLNNPKSKLSLDPNKRLVVFDLQKLKDDPVLAPVMFFVIRSAIYSRLADLTLRKIIVIDEGWQFFSDESGSMLIENLYRTARKFDGAVLSISQSPEDFIKTPAANAITSNSYTKYFLRITDKHELLSHFGLNESEIAEVKGLEMIPGKYSEVLYKFLKHSIVLRVIPNKLDYWICTTNAKDRNTEEEMKKKYPDLDLARVILKLSSDEEAQND